MLEIHGVDTFRCVKPKGIYVYYNAIVLVFDFMLLLAVDNRTR